MSRRPPDQVLRKAKARMAPGGLLRSEAPVRPPLLRVRLAGVPSATPETPGALLGTVTATTTITGTLVAVHPLAGTVAGVTTITGTLTASAADVYTDTYVEEY